MSKKIVLWMLFAVLSNAVLWAQEKTVLGKVSDESGLPLPGVTVVVKNTSRGVATDMERRGYH